MESFDRAITRQVVDQEIIQRVIQIGAQLAFLHTSSAPKIDASPEEPTLMPVPVTQLASIPDSTINLIQQIPSYVIDIARTCLSKKLSNTGFIHGDFKPDNIFAANGMVKFIDWERAGFGGFIHDLAAFIAGVLSIRISSVGLSGIGNLERSREALYQASLGSWKISGAFLAGYYSIVPSVEEYENLTRHIGVKMLARTQTVAHVDSSKSPHVVAAISVIKQLLKQKKQKMLSCEEVVNTDIARWIRNVSHAVKIENLHHCTRNRTGEAISLIPSSSTIQKLTKWLYLDVHLLGKISDDGEPMSLNHPIWESVNAKTDDSYISPGWLFENLDNGDILATQGVVQVVIPCNEISAWVIPNEKSLKLRRYRPNAIFGWHTFFSQFGASNNLDTRLYLADLANGDYLTALIQALDKTETKWMGKLAANAESKRPDRLVLYFDEEILSTVVKVITLTRRQLDVSPCVSPGFASELCSGIFGAKNKSSEGASHGMLVARSFSRVLCGVDPDSEFEAEIAGAISKIGFSEC